MPYDVFCRRVEAITGGLGLSVVFSHKDGKHYADASDGTKIVGNSVSKRVEVIWGSGHKAYATI